MNYIVLLIHKNTKKEKVKKPKSTRFKTIVKYFIKLQPIIIFISTQLINIYIKD